MYAALRTDSAKIGPGVLKTNKNAADIIGDVDGGGYGWLVTLRNSIMGGQENVDAFVAIMNYVEKISSGEIIAKYAGINFSNVNYGINQVFEYLIGDVTEARTVLAKADILTGMLADLMKKSPEGGIVALILSFMGDDVNGSIGAMIDAIIAQQVPESLQLGVASIMHSLLGNIDFNKLTTKDVLGYFDMAISELKSMKTGIQTVNLEQAVYFAKSIISGEILSKYYGLQNISGVKAKTLLKYVKDDIDGSVAVLQIGNLLDQALSSFLGGYKVSDIVKDYLLITLPNMLNTAFESRIDGAGKLYLGEVVTEMLTPKIRGYDISSTIRSLQVSSKSLSYMIYISNLYGR